MLTATENIVIGVTVGLVFPFSVYYIIGGIIAYMFYRNTSRWYSDYSATNNPVSREVFDDYLKWTNVWYFFMWPIEIFEICDGVLTKSYEELSLWKRAEIDEDLIDFMENPDNSEDDIENEIN